MRDVAAQAGVAVGTVSHYLNHPGKVSPEKAARIRQAIDALGFVPNNAGRQLRLGRSSAIAYIAPDVSNPFFSSIAEGVEQRASQLNLVVFLANSHRSRERENTYLDVFEQNRVRGMLVASHEPIEDRLLRVRARGTPCVLVGQAAMSDEQASVSIDDVSGGRLAGTHLAELGRRRLAFVGGPLNIRQIGDRLSGASAAVRDHGLATLEVIDMPDRTVRGGREAARLVLERPADSRPDGIFASNDLLALGMMQVLISEGVRVPDDVAIVGYDDIEFGEASLIPLTSVKPPHETFGFAAVDLLVDEIADRGDHPRHRVFEPQLVVRASTTGGAAGAAW
ncbi:LacI family transcriptional regulator [Jiangella aurantiaca]|uniref:LacI family transcriptional regulator n=1 Tax=Jiangella aurantiaca TaxID=2530373 RepID=A0A4R5AM12_9ACTN|nr:LacI family transcriptional regulator [Jiangella aurantiaca]